MWLIGATTTAEYRRDIERDPALERRFQAVWVEEPTRDHTCARAVLPCSAEEFAVRSGSDENQIFRVPLVDQQPVAGQMTFPTVPVVADQSMIPEALRQLLTLGEFEDGCFQNGDVAI